MIADWIMNAPYKNEEWEGEPLLEEEDTE